MHEGRVGSADKVVPETEVHPDVSVIIASYNAREVIGGCLESLQAQSTSRLFELIVVDSSTDGTADYVAVTFPEVRVLRFRDRKYCGGARNAGISIARGTVIAFTDADCRVATNWIEEIARAHERPELAIGGAIGNANPASYVGWAAYLCEFSQWMPGMRARWLTDMPGANLSYKRQAFARYGGFIEGTYCSDTNYHWRLGQEGQCLWFEPSILVFHHNIPCLRRFLSHEYHHGLSFGRVRVQSLRWSCYRRALYLLLAPIIPLRILGKVALNCLVSGRGLVALTVTMPLLIAGIVCWSAGEIVSYATCSTDSIRALEQDAVGARDDR